MLPSRRPGTPPSAGGDAAVGRPGTPPFGGDPVIATPHYPPFSIAAVKAVLLGVPASHPTLAAELMLERKGIEVARYDLLTGVHPLLLRTAFPGGTVPAVVLDGQRLQGSRNISRALDAIVPDPRLFPREPERRAAVEQAELWGELVLQPAARRLTWAAVRRERSAIESYLEGAKMALPAGLAARTAAPFVWLSARRNRATDRAARRDLAALPGMLARVDGLISGQVIGAEDPNAADFPIATSLRLLMTLEDLRPAIQPRPGGRLALRLVPDYPGRMPPVFPTEWLDSVRNRP
jgi:glutathione S-transferase